MATGRPRERFADLRSASDSPRLQPDAFVLKTMDRLVESFADEATHLHCSEDFIRAMVDRFVEAFRRLDAIDRDDPFWDGTNRRPTQYKLYASSEVAIRADPSDCDAFWRLVAVHTVFGSAFDPDPWERLATACPVDPTWIVDAALLAECRGSYDTVPDIARILPRMKMCDRVRSRLEDLIARGRGRPGGGCSAGWATRALEACDRARIEPISLD